MAYYPKSQVKTNLYTNGDEYVLSITKQEYTGYYYKTSSGAKYTGKNPDIKPSILLQPIEPGLDAVEEEFSDASFQSVALRQKLSTTIEIESITPSATNYVSENDRKRSIPQFSVTLPTAEDKKRGYFMRYFCKKNNELIYYETSQANYDKTKNQDPTMAYDLYSVLALQWSFTGDPSQVANFNISSITRASSLNNWTGFIQYFKGNYTQYLGS
jgi:hypothetical protein